MTMEETNGGRHSRLGADYFRIDPKALKVLAEILHEGAKSHQDDTGENWRLIPTKVHLNHAIAHIYDYLSGGTAEDNLGHAFTRLMFAVAIDRKTEPSYSQVPFDPQKIMEKLNKDVLSGKVGAVPQHHSSHPTDKDGYHL